MWVSDNGGFCDCGVLSDCAFYFGCAESVPGDVQYVIDAAGNPVVAVFIAQHAVACHVIAGEPPEIGIDESPVVCVNSAHDTGPGCFDAEIPACGVAFYFVACLVQNHGFDAEERERRGARFHRGCCGQGSHQNAAGFGLPPRINDGASVFADGVVIPEPFRFLNRFAYRA